MKRKLNQRQVSCWCSSITYKSSTSSWEMIIHPFKLDFQAFPRLPKEPCSERAIFGIWGNSMGSARGGRPRLGNSLLSDDQNQDDKWKFLLLDKQGPLLLLYVNVCLRYGRWASLWASRQAGQRWWARPRRQKYRARTALPTGPAGPFSRTARAELEKRRTAENLAGENVSRTLSLEQRVAWAGQQGTSGADGGVIR